MAYASVIAAQQAAEGNGMKTLSIKQPWAWLIANGLKDIENRDWRYPPKFRGGPLLIHAGKLPTILDDRFIELCRRRQIKIPGDLPLGGIVGQAEIVDVVTASRSPWFFGPLGFVLRKARPLSFMPYKGQLGFFEVDYRP
jgi:hypothetical protein